MRENIQREVYINKEKRMDSVRNGLGLIEYSDVIQKSHNPHHLPYPNPDLTTFPKGQSKMDCRFKSKS